MAPEGIAIKKDIITAHGTITAEGALPTKAANCSKVPSSAMMLINPKKIPTENKVVKIYLEPSPKASQVSLIVRGLKIATKIAVIITLVTGMKMFMPKSLLIFEPAITMISNARAGTA